MSYIDSAPTASTQPDTTTSRTTRSRNNAAASIAPPATTRGTPTRTKHAPKSIAAAEKLDEPKTAGNTSIIENRL